MGPFTARFTFWIRLSPAHLTQRFLFARTRITIPMFLRARIKQSIWAWVVIYRSLGLCHPKMKDVVDWTPATRHMLSIIVVMRFVVWDHFLYRVGLARHILWTCTHAPRTRTHLPPRITILYPAHAHLRVTLPPRRYAAYHMDFTTHRTHRTFYTLYAF